MLKICFWFELADVLYFLLVFFAQNWLSPPHFQYIKVKYLIIWTIISSLTCSKDSYNVFTQFGMKFLNNLLRVVHRWPNSGTSRWRPLEKKSLYEPHSSRHVREQCKTNKLEAHNMIAWRDINVFYHLLLTAAKGSCAADHSRDASRRRP